MNSPHCCSRVKGNNKLRQNFEIKPVFPVKKSEIIKQHTANSIKFDHKNKFKLRKVSLKTSATRQSNHSYHLEPSRERCCRGRRRVCLRTPTWQSAQTSHRDVRSKEKHGLQRGRGREGRELVMHSPSIQRAAWRTKIRHPGPCSDCWSKASPPTRAMTARLWPTLRTIHLQPSDASITMAAPQLRGPTPAAQNIIRGTMKCPGHWQLI